MAKNDVVVNTTILQSKQELVNALDMGLIKVSKYNTLKPEEQEFVKLVVFGQYQPYQAIKVVAPHIKDHYAAGKAWAMRPDVRDTLEELTYKSDAHWMTQLANGRELGLRHMIHLLTKTKDEALQMAIAKELVKVGNEGTKKPVDTNQGTMINVGLKFAPNVNAEDVKELQYGVAIAHNYQKKE